ncbi:hypothetical protein [Edwardsiella anguillarum]|uniref:MarR family transcriptional regulator n=1 Tax=Edwardsiella anguillarum TaxID=1821960 RepID=A0ABY8SJI1_9GAMM|nr:hypothetical protein [Edwardsiella anguillarum]WHP85877.1 hypothetical protein MQ095_20170 [Edwardsiella anguillarum]WHP89718.1 hypothetical protein MQ088_19995 [Edwardsiella anguillarum]WHP93517.1 hypothetical protein MQ091_19980 [Edwardsiella anguillarum]WHP97274.1 hypothetical protein MQ096_20210 [Edwardsiella anguillarum]WHQ01120.1 hypothetical protein MQ082_20110 [Edwardsiella anguillarum]
MKSLLADALKYIESSFLIDTKILQGMDEYLPFQLRKSATLCSVSIDDREFMVLTVDNPELLMSTNLVHLKRLDAKSDLPLIIVTSELTVELKNISKQLKKGLIIPGRYVSMPSLMLQSETKNVISERWVDTESSYGIIPSYLIAYYLSGYFDSGFNSMDIVGLLGVSKMAFSRAVKELLSHKLISESSCGRSSHFRFIEPRKRIWNHYRHRISPLSTGFVPVRNEIIKAAEVFLSGESALSKYTLLSSPSRPFLGKCLTDKDRYMRPITPATMQGDYFFKILNVLEDAEYYHTHIEGFAMLQVFPYQPAIQHDTLNKVFLLFSRFNATDLRVKSSYSELEDQVYSNLKD